LAGLAQCTRFPITGLDARRQKDLVEFNSRLTTMQTDTEGLPVKEKLSHLVEHSGLSSAIYYDTEANLRLDHLLELAASFHTRSGEFLAAVAMNQDTDFYDARAEKVALMTMHAAKGLEFPVVFVTGCEEGLIPYHRNAQDKGDEAEERRLFYVAMTRARDQLYLTCAHKRPIYGKQVDRVLSPFVADIEERLKRDDSPSFKGNKKKCNNVQLKLF